MADALIIFIKNPIAGKTKTRLAKSLGDDKALEIYHSLCNITRKEVEQIELSRQLYYSSFIDEKDDWSNDQYHKKLQVGTDLGSRMSHAFRCTLESYDKACIIGSDCPTIHHELIEEALIKLNEFDFVIGPSTDGGYYLLGMKNHSNELFKDISWSTEKVLSQTIDAIKKIEKTYFLLEELTDIDEENDWLQFKNTIALNEAEDPFIYHMAAANSWADQKDHSVYYPAAYHEEGFIHCCFKNQFEHVLSNYFKTGQKIYVLKIDARILADKLKVEKAKNGAAFPHIYSVIDKKWITSINLIENKF